MKRSTTLICLFFGMIFTLSAQVTDVNYIIEYNDATELYDCKLVIIEGEANTYPERIQFNSQFTIVVPTGTTLTIDTLYNPKEANQFYNGNVPCLWEFGPKEISPPTQPEHDFHTIFPNLSPPSAYNNLKEGDIITLFSVSADLDPCDNLIRPFENGIDPSSIDMPSGGDFSNGHTFGGGVQVYSGNMPSGFGSYIAPNDMMSICTDECVTLEPTFHCLPDVLKYEWSTGETTETIEVCPTEPMEYYLLIYNENDNFLDSLLVFVEIASLNNEEIIKACAGSAMELESCSGNGVWTQAAGNPSGASLFTLTEEVVEVTFSENAEGEYDFIYTVDGISETQKIVVYPNPVISLSTTEVCIGAVVNASTNIVGGTWKSDDPTIAMMYANSKIYGINEGSATFTYTAPSGCSTTSEAIEVTLEVDAVLTGPDEICIGSTTTVSPNVGGYWTSANSIIATVTSSGIVTGISTGVTIVQFQESGTGCRSNSIEITVIAPTIELTGSNGICVGGSTTLISESIGTWTSSDPAVATISVATGLVTGVSPGYATFTFFETSTSCFSMASETVYVSLIPYVEIQDSELCIGETTQVSSDPEGIWVSDDPLIATVNPTTGLVTAVGSGTVRFSVTNEFGCSSNSIPLELVVLLNPEVEILGPAAICPMQMTTLSPNSGGTWTSSNGDVASVDNFGGVIGIQSGTALLSYTDSETGCISDPLEIIVIGTSYIPTTSSNAPICEWEDLYLTTPYIEGASYEWFHPSGAVFSNEQNPIVSNATFSEQGSFCVIVSIDGCESTEGCVDVYLNPYPATPTSNNNGPLCEGDDLELATADVPGAIFLWTGPDGYSSTEQNPTISGMSLANSGTYCLVIVTDGCDSEAGCTSVVINSFPATPTVSNNSPLCEGDNLALTTDAVAGATYSWTGPDGFSSDQQNPMIIGATPATSGSYCVQVNIDDCPSLAGCTEVFINSSSFTPLVSNNGPVCEDENLELFANVVAESYAWTGPNGFASIEQNPVIIGTTASESGNYCLVVTTNGCISAESCTEAIISPTPNIPLVNNSGPVCEGSEISLLTNLVPNATYAWTGPNGFTTTEYYPVFLNVTSSISGTYCVIVTVDGCASLESCTDLLVNPTPATPNVSSNGPICEGQDLELSSDLVISGSYEWTGPNGFTSTNQNPTISGADPSDNGTYCVLVTVDGCESESVCVDALVIPRPATPIVNSNAPICNGENLELTTDEVVGATYSWYDPSGAFFSDDQNPVVPFGALLGSGVISLTVSVDGCQSDPGSTAVEILSIDDDLTITNNSPVCIGEMVELSVEEVAGASYTWSGPLGASFAGPSVSFLADEFPPGIYEVRMSIDECFKTNTTDVIFMEAETFTVGDNVLCIGESTSIFPISGGTYSLSNSDIGVVNGGSFVAFESGTTELTYTSDFNGCTSIPVTITVVNCIEAEMSCDDIDAEDIMCDYNDLINFQGTLSEQNSGGNQPSDALCSDGDDEHNISWLGFVALEGDYTLVVNTTNCTQSNIGEVGVLVGVYSECNFSEQTKVFCEYSLKEENEIRIPSTILTPGQTYFLYIDGYDGSICDYSIDVDGFYDNTYCTDLSKVTGVAYIDDNENGAYEVGETLLRNALISLSPGNFSVLTNNEGKYIINTPKGGATLTAKMNEGHWINDELTIADLTIFETCVEGIDFGFVPNLFYQEAKISVANTVTRCDWETRFYFTVENTGTIDLDAKFEFEFDDKASYFATNLIGLQVNGEVASGDLGIIKPFEVREYWIKLKMPQGSTVLPMLDFKTTLFNDGDIEMDSYEQSEQLRCSYDPNDKREYPNREGDDNLTLMDEDLEYTIRFQNNGNDTAFLVKIIDPLDPNIEPTSIRVINSSHSVETCIENEKLIFIFENINLVDSMTNYDGSQGFVSFRCNSKEGIPENTIVNNTADIIFDTNVPIVTNTTINTLVSKLCTNVSTEVDIVICEGDTYNGYDKSGTYTEFFPLTFGCDSMVIINLEVQGITYSSQEIEICEGETFEVNGNEYILYESQELMDTTENALGCISNIFIFDVQVNPIENINIDVTICEGLDYQGLTESGTYSFDSFDVVTGCDIITTLNLEVLPMNDPSCIVGIDELTSSDIKIYPIPARGEFYLEGEIAIDAVSIYSMDYQKLREIAIESHGNKLQISTEGMSVGIYIVAVRSADMIIYKKLIVE